MIDRASPEWTRMWPLGCVLLAAWPVWRWTAQRLMDGADGIGAWLGLATVIAFLIGERRQLRTTAIDLRLTCALLLMYAVAYLHVPPLIRAILAVTAVAALLSEYWFGRRLDLRVACLLLLCLPVGATLNFYLGYPLRIVVGEISAVLLQWNGVPVEREGTVLRLGEELVSVDAPCSGVRMLWAAMYVAVTLAAFMRFDAVRTLALLCASVPLVIAANVLRATALFYVEARLLPPMPVDVHASIGVLSFVFAASLVIFTARSLQRHAYAH